MNYNISENNFKDFILGSGWPSYKNISIYEMTRQLEPESRRSTEDNSKINLDPDNIDTNPNYYNTAPRYNTTPNYNTNPNYDTAPNYNTTPSYDTTPRYDTAPGSSRVTNSYTSDVTNRESRLMKELYSELNKLLAAYAVRILDEYEYVNSPIYDEEGIDRETLAQLVSRTIDLANNELDETQEIMLDTVTNGNGWNRSQLLTNLIQSLILSEIFLVRRPRYRRARNNYRFSNGSYNGINPQ